MKNLTLLVERDAIHAHVRKLWRTDVFRRSHDDPNGYIHQLVEQFAAVPRLFYDMTSQRLETAHFTVWFNAIAHRPWYKSGAIHDLYYHHELAHAATMAFDDALPWNRWYSKMVINEFDASMESEVLIYFRLPELRAIAFPHDIWVDRLLGRAELSGPFREHGPAAERRQAAAIELMREMRRRAMTTPDPFDFLELQIAEYVRSNLVWARMWQDTRNVIEGHMLAFQKEAAGDRIAAAAMHRAWIEALMAEDRVRSLSLAGDEEPGSAIPFRREADAYADIYWGGKEAYGNAKLAN